MAQTKWTLEACKAAALKYKTRTEWQKKAVGAYESAWRNGWMEECCAHMEVKRRTFTPQELDAAAKLYQTRKAFKLGHPNEYQAAYRAGRLAECCAHMTELARRWSTEELKAAALVYQTRGEFEKGDPKAYNTALRRKLVDECCAHMDRARAPHGHWNKERCTEKARGFDNIAAWQKAHGASYQAAAKNGWLNACTAHMTNLRTRWSDELASAEAAKYQTRSAFIRGCGSAYNYLKASGGLELACAHMIKVIEKSDAVYVWQALGEAYNSKGVYKIGVARAEAKLSRIQRCAHKNGMRFKLLAFRLVGPRHAKTLEKHLLGFGEDPRLDVKEGKTEFRALTDAEVSNIIGIIERHPII